VFKSLWQLPIQNSQVRPRIAWDTLGLMASALLIAHQVLFQTVRSVVLPLGRGKALLGVCRLGHQGIGRLAVVGVEMVFGIGRSRATMDEHAVKAWVSQPRRRIVSALPHARLRLEIGEHAPIRVAVALNCGLLVAAHHVRRRIAKDIAQ
jgi:hypothetical protein